MPPEESPGQPSTTYVAARVVTPSGIFSPGWLTVEGRSFAEVGEGRPPASGDGVGVVDLGETTAVPGFVDMHVHGGGGAAFTEGLAGARRVRDTHLRHGTTSMAASLVTDSVDRLEQQLVALRPLVQDGALLGIHLEGPWLSERHPGAHHPGLLCDPTPADVERLITAGDGALAMATLAIERDGAPDAAARLIAAGVVVALGHSDATYDEAHHAVDAGARVATHLFNAERPIGHREPGLVVALLERDEVTVELVADGLHLHEAIVRDVARLAGPRTALVSDAMAAAGAPDGRYQLGPLDVRVRDREARLVSPDGSAGAIAGSTLTLDRALRVALRCGLPLPEAVLALSTTPADTLGRPDLGRLAAGCRADLVCLDSELLVAGVMLEGAWIAGVPTEPARRSPVT